MPHTIEPERKKGSLRVWHTTVDMPQGPSCPQCEARLIEAVRGLRGIEEVHYVRDDRLLHVRYMPDVARLSTLEQTVKEIGLHLEHRYGHETMHLSGLDCPDCARKLEMSVGQKPGVNWVEVNFAGSVMNLEYDRDVLDREAIVERVAKIGYRVEEPDPGQERASHFRARYGRMILIAVSGLLFALAYVLDKISPVPLLTVATPEERLMDLWTPRVLFLASLILSGYPVARSGFYALRARTLDISFLVTIAAAGAIYLGKWSEAAMVMFLFGLGNALEAMSMSRTRRAIRALIRLKPRQARRKEGDHEDLVPIEALHPGDVIVVRPGDRIPMDGKIILGQTEVDESALTGESVPVFKDRDKAVLAGSINLSGRLEIEVTRKAEDTTLAKVLKLVEEAQTVKAPAQQFSERFGRIYTPVVVGVALLIAVFGPLITGRNFQAMLYTALTLLVVSCPCALVISTPVAVVAAIGNAARRGILIKGGAFLEAAGKLQVVVFDKTGTLTRGEPEVTDIIPLKPGLCEKGLMERAGSLESCASHPVAEAIVRRAQEMGVTIREVDEFRNEPGQGIRGSIGGRASYAGNIQFCTMQSDVVPERAAEAIKSLEAEGKTAFVVGEEGEVLGVIAVSDALRENAGQAVEDLRRRGMKKVIMLTGDNKAAGQAIARRVHVDEVHSQLLPEDKVAAIRELLREYTAVAMVGDGINDAPALAASSVGIAVGARGTDVALETADIVLMGDDLRKVGQAIGLGRDTLRVIRQNIFISLVAIVSLLTLTFVGVLDLTFGIIAHEGSALLVIGNGMRLLGRRV